MFSRREFNAVCYISSKSPAHEPSVVKFQRCEHASGSRKGPEPVPSTSGESETAACPQSPAADDPSSLPFPTASPPVTNSSSLFTHRQPMYASCCSFVVYFSRYCKIKNFYFLFVCHVLFACEVL